MEQYFSTITAYLLLQSAQIVVAIMIRYIKKYTKHIKGLKRIKIKRMSNKDQVKKSRIRFRAKQKTIQIQQFRIRVRYYKSQRLQIRMLDRKTRLHYEGQFNMGSYPPQLYQVFPKMENIYDYIRLAKQNIFKITKKGSIFIKCSTSGPQSYLKIPTDLKEYDLATSSSEQESPIQPPLVRQQLCKAVQIDFQKEMNTQKAFQYEECIKKLENCSLTTKDLKSSMSILSQSMSNITLQLKQIKHHQRYGKQQKRQYQRIVTEKQKAEGQIQPIHIPRIARKAAKKVVYERNSDDMTIEEKNKAIDFENSQLDKDPAFNRYKDNVVQYYTDRHPLMKPEDIVDVIRRSWKRSSEEVKAFYRKPEDINQIMQPPSASEQPKKRKRIRRFKKIRT